MLLLLSVFLIYYYKLCWKDNIYSFSGHPLVLREHNPSSGSGPANIFQLVKLRTREGSIVSTQEQEQDSEGINVILGRNWPISHCEGGHKDIKWVSGGCWLQSRVSGETSTTSSRSRDTDVSVHLATARAQPRFRVIIWSSVHQTL